MQQYNGCMINHELRMDVRKKPLSNTCHTVERQALEHAVAEVVVTCLSRGRDRVRSQVYSSGIRSEYSGTGTGFSRIPPFSSSIIILPVLHSHLHAALRTSGRNQVNFKYSRVFLRKSGVQ